MKLKIRIISFLCFSLVLLCGAPVSAASCGCKIVYGDGSSEQVIGVETNLISNANGCYCSDKYGGSIMTILMNVFNILSGIVMPLAVAGIVIAGVIYLTARDNENQVIKAKRRIFQIGIGLFSYALVWSFLNWLVPGGVFNAGSKVTEMTTLSPSELAALNATTPSSGSTTTPSGSTTTTPSSGSTTTPSGSTTTTPSGSTTTTPSGSTTTPSSTLPNSSSSTKLTSYYDNTGAKVNFLLYAPNTADGKKLPLIIYLHGDGAGGLPAEQFKYIPGLNEFSNWNTYDNLDGPNAYILCPQTKNSSIDWNNAGVAARDEVWAKVKSMIDEGKVDPSKVSIVGQSRGSYGLQRFITDAARVGQFSAAVLLSGFRSWDCDLSVAPPMKFIYGGKDSAVIERGGIDSFRQYAEIKQYPEAEHGTLPKAALTDDANNDNKSDLLEWILSQTAKTPVK